MIPFRAKAIKLLLTEYQSSPNARGLNADQDGDAEIESDDGVSAGSMPELGRLVLTGAVNA